MDKCEGFKKRWDNVDGDQEIQQTQHQSRYWFLLGWTDAERQIDRETCSDCERLILQRRIYDTKKPLAVEKYCPWCEQKEVLRKTKLDVEHYRKLSERYKKNRDCCVEKNVDLMTKMTELINEATP